MAGQSAEGAGLEAQAAERGRILRSAGAVAALTMVSRLAGYGRDIVFTFFFGTSIYADAYVAAFQLPNVLRRLVGEGNVSAAFVPVFEHEAASRPGDEVWRLADNFHFALAVVAAILTAVGMLLAPVLVRTLLVPGRPDAWELTTRLVWLCFPYLIFISAASSLMAVLNARDRFSATAFTPVLYNLTLISAALVMVRVDMPIYVWALAAVVGGFLQWLFLVPQAWRLGMRFLPRGGWRDPALRRIAALMVPGIFGVGISQFNVLVGRALASWLEPGSIASLFYGGRITELPLGVFAIAIATVVLPLMSRQAARNAEREMLATVTFALRQVAFITLPATVGLIVLRTEIIAVLFERGQFGPDSTATTAAALAGYSAGMMGIAGVRVVAPSFFARRNTRTPVQVGAIAMVVNVLACLLLIRFLDHAGIALASSLAAYVNFGLLVWLLQSEVGRLDLASIAKSFARLSLASLAMGWVIWGLRARWLVDASPTGLMQAAALLATIGVGVVTYVAAAALLRSPELRELRAMRGGGGV